MAKKKKETDPVQEENPVETDLVDNENESTDSPENERLEKDASTEPEKKETDPVQEENPVEKKAKRGIRDSGEKKADAERREKLAGKVKEIFLDGAQQDVLRRLNADSVAREMFVALLDRRRNGEHDATGGKEAIAAMSGRIARSPAEIARVIDHVLQRLSAK